jgi:hypothetical protein
MLVSGLIKLLLFYFAYVVIRQIYRGHKTVQHLRTQMEKAKNQANDFGQSSTKSPSQGNPADIVEAEYRVVKDS